jgi:hypothetical protein
MSTKDYIVQQIMVNAVIYARKAAIDQFVDGLCALRFLELLVNFPLTFEPLFLASKANTPGVDDILEWMTYLVYYSYHQIAVLTRINKPSLC